MSHIPGTPFDDAAVAPGDNRAPLAAWAAAAFDTRHAVIDGHPAGAAPADGALPGGTLRDGARSGGTLRDGALSGGTRGDGAQPGDPLPPCDRPPLSFRLGDAPVDLRGWPLTVTTRATASADVSEYTWTDPASGLRVTATLTRFREFAAVDWVLRLENAGSADTPIIADVRALDVALACPLAGAAPYRLHRTLGAPSTPRDFEPTTVDVTAAMPQRLGAAGGWSSNGDFPFFTVETGGGTWVVAVGWSAQWAAEIGCPDGRTLCLAAGQEVMHLRLRPGEHVRTPRILLYHGPADVDEAHAGFRQLIYAEYVARRGGKRPLPLLFSNTCFTRGGGWLNECDAANQISLIEAFAPLGLEAVITDAGWFEGGWPDGAGNWTPRREAYPEGMGPVAAAAARHGMVYGLWFEPERAMAGSALQRAHPEWLLNDPAGNHAAFVVDFGRPEVRAHFFELVRGFMGLPGFRVYRQDSTMAPLPYWRAADAPDRQGFCEAKYIEGLYAYWDRIAATWPDGVREECASGGRRIDLETLMRMHIHQRSDYWFDDETEQVSLWSLSRYLPGNIITTALNRIDDYSFAAALPSSLCIGWIADAPGFDGAAARRLTETYRRVRHLLVGAWYPLLPYSRDGAAWQATQFHRPDLDAGLVVALRRPASAQATMMLRCRGIDATAEYEVQGWHDAAPRVVAGAELCDGLTVTIDAPRGAELVTYQRVGGATRGEDSPRRR